MGRGKFIAGKRRDRETEGRKRQFAFCHCCRKWSSGGGLGLGLVCFAADPIMVSRGKMTIPEILRRVHEPRF